MKRNKLAYLLLLVTLFVTTACKSDKKGNSNWMKEDDVNVAIDETFKPIMDNLVQSYGMAYPEANMKPQYVSEDEAIRMLAHDSLRCAIVTRKLKENELNLIRSHRLDASQALIASDAIALVINKENNDSLITLDEVKGIVSGRITRWEQLAKNRERKGELHLIFDNSGSSTVRYMKDSLCNGQDLKGNVYASEGKNNESVLKMVEENPNIIGVVGANWLMGKQGNAMADFSKLPFKVMRVSRTADEFAKYVRPYQYYIATADYPLLRSVYVIHTDPRSQSMLKNFYFYLKGQKGQTIICNNSQMLPITPVQVKDVSIK